ncbi:MAG: hypothetical protein FJZ58_03995 [Chlamydiae bacterium]|nr:hypothetical protein [Chlamydiota bacterium]
MLAVLIVGTLYFVSNSWVLIPFTYDQEGFPRIEVQVGDLSCSLLLDLGSRFPLFLDQTTIQSTLHQYQGPIQWNEMNGETKEAPSYTIPEIKIGQLSISRPTAIEIPEDQPSLLGSVLDKNLLLDFPHARILACSRLFKLCQEGRTLAKWIKVPYTNLPLGIAIQVDTTFGIKTLVLSTSVNVSGLKSSCLPGSKPSLSTCTIGEREFESMIFHPIPFPDKESLSDVDGFLALDFLKNHPMYVDVHEKMIYIQPPTEYFTRIPVTFNLAHFPVVDVQVEGAIYPMIVDLGGEWVQLSQRVLRDLRKTSVGVKTWEDYFGNPYVSPLYKISGMAIQDLFLIEVETTPLSEEFLDATSSSYFCHRPLGLIGCSLLERYNLLLDFPHQAIYACKEVSSLQQKGLLSSHLLVIPFDTYGTRILLSVEVDSKPVHLLLDTGFTNTTLFDFFSSKARSFCIGGHDFGEQPIASAQTHSLTRREDGYLGMDFLCKYPLFIDYQKKQIVIDLGPPGD